MTDLPPWAAKALQRIKAFSPKVTNAHRIIHGFAHDCPGWYLDRYGGWLLSQSEQPLSEKRRNVLTRLMECESGLKGVYHKVLNRLVRQSSPRDSSPKLALGEPAPGEFAVRENGVRYAIRFGEGYSVGLFLDQRDNRGRLLGTAPEAVQKRFKIPRSGEALNTFSYTCGFSVCAAKAGWNVTSLDLSQKYLDWGCRNFELNGLEPNDHDFIYGDAFEWMKRLQGKRRQFDLVILDPPTFSKAKKGAVFQTEKDYGRLVVRALSVLNPGGVILACCNTARLSADRFMSNVEKAVSGENRQIRRRWIPDQPPDFPETPAEPAYLKQIWMSID